MSVRRHFRNSTPSLSAFISVPAISQAPIDSVSQQCHLPAPGLLLRHGTAAQHCICILLGVIQFNDIGKQHYLNSASYSTPLRCAVPTNPVLRRRCSLVIYPAALAKLWCLCFRLHSRNPMVHPPCPVPLTPASISIGGAESDLIPWDNIYNPTYPGGSERTNAAAQQQQWVEEGRKEARTPEGLHARFVYIPLFDLILFLGFSGSERREEEGESRSSCRWSEL